MAAPTGEYTVVKAKHAGSKPNPHGGQLEKFYCSLLGPDGVQHDDVYWQRKSAELAEGEKAYGHIEDGQYGPRFKTDQRQNGAGGGGASFSPPPDSGREESIARAVAFKGAVELIAAPAAYVNDETAAEVAKLTEELLPIVTGSSANGSAPAVQPAKGASPEPSSSSPEASPAQKGRLTQEFNKAGLTREQMKAVVLYRCHSEKVTKDAASRLIDELSTGQIDRDGLLSEIFVAVGAGDEWAEKARKLIPDPVPVDTEGLDEPNDPDPEIQF